MGLRPGPQPLPYAASKAAVINLTKMPERLEIVDEFPVSTFGKVSKKALAERIATA